MAIGTHDARRDGSAPPPSAETLRSGGRRRRGMVVGAVVLVLVVAAATAVVATRSSGPDYAVVRPDAGMDMRSSWRRGMPPTAGEKAREEQLIHATRRALMTIKDTDDARRAGWTGVKVAGSDGLEHWLNPAFVDDGRTLDPERPEALVVRPSTGDVVGAMFVSYGATPQPGPDAVWHRHRLGVTACYPSIGTTFQAVVSDPTAMQRLEKPPCRAGYRAMDATPFMLHVWLVDTKGGPFDIDMDSQGQDTSRRLS